MGQIIFGLNSEVARGTGSTVILIGLGVQSFTGNVLTDDNHNCDKEHRVLPFMVLSFPGQSVSDL